MSTIMDIARATGLSLMTVSRAFNTPDRVKPQTLERIMQAAEELDYHPNNVARSLARKRTGIVLVYVPKGLAVTEQFVLQTVTSIGERLGERGYSLLLSRKPPEGESYDGVIMMGMSREEEQAIDIAHITKPVVLYGNSNRFTSWVDVDNYRGERLAVEYLLEKGKRSIAAICAPQSMRYAEERLLAYEHCLAERGMDVNGKIVVGEANEHSGYLCAKQLLSSNVQPDAIVCATDTMAIGCIRALREQGICVPQDIAVIGFDGFGHENVASPKLTTVRQPLYEVGTQLVDTLISLIEGGNAQQIKILPTLVQGESA